MIFLRTKLTDWHNFYFSSFTYNKIQKVDITQFDWSQFFMVYLYLVGSDKKNKMLTPSIQVIPDFPLQISMETKDRTKYLLLLFYGSLLSHHPIITASVFIMFLFMFTLKFNILIHVLPITYSMLLIKLINLKNTTFYMVEIQFFLPLGHHNFKKQWYQNK